MADGDVAQRTSSSARRPAQCSPSAYGKDLSGVKKERFRRRATMQHHCSLFVSIFSYLRYIKEVE